MAVLWRLFQLSFSSWAVTKCHPSTVFKLSADNWFSHNDCQWITNTEHDRLEHLLKTAKPEVKLIRRDEKRAAKKCNKNKTDIEFRRTEEETKVWKMELGDSRMETWEFTGKTTNEMGR